MDAPSANSIKQSSVVRVLALLAFFLPIIAWSLTRVELNNETERWLPQGDQQLVSLQRAREQFPISDRILVTWDSSSLSDPRVLEVARNLEGELDSRGAKQKGSRLIADVIIPQVLLNRMQENGIEGPESVRRLTGVLIGPGTLKLALTEAGKSRSQRVRQKLIEEARKRFEIQLSIREGVPDIEGLSTPLTVVGEGESPWKAAVLGPDGNLLADHPLRHDLQLTWKGILPGSEATTEICRWLQEFTLTDEANRPIVESCFFVPGSPVGLAVGLSPEGQAEKASVAKAIQAVAEQAGVPLAELHLAGSPIAETELNRAVKLAAWNKDAPLWNRSVLGLSVLVSILVTLIQLKDLRLTFVVLAISAYTTVAATSLVPFYGYSLNMVTAVLPILLMVLTLSGAIHVANYWKHASFHDDTTAIENTRRHAFWPCFLASLTTIIGLLSLCTSVLTPVREFGIFGAIGVAISFVMVIYALPEILALSGSKPRGDEELTHPGWSALGELLIRRPILTCALLMVACIVPSLGLAYFRTETKVIRYFPQQSSIVSDYWSIEQRLAGVSSIEVIVRYDEKAQDESNVVSRLEQIRQLEERLRQLPEITGALSLASFMKDSEVMPANASAMTKSRFNKRASIVKNKLRDREIPGSESFYTIDDAGTESNQHRTGDELWRISLQASVMTDTDYAVILRDVESCCQEILRFDGGAQHTITGTTPLFLRTQQAVLESLISSSALAFGLTLLIMVVMLKDLRAGLVSMIPNVVPLTIVFGAMSFFNQRIDMGTMITASIALGIAVDGTLHYLTWLRKELLEGSSLNRAIVHSLAHCGPAMWQTSVIITLGLAFLFPADLSLISRFGVMMSSMVFVALLADILLLPVLLATPVGRVFIPVQDVPDDMVLALAGGEPAPVSNAGYEDATAESAAPPSTVPAPHAAFQSVGTDGSKTK